MSDINTELAMVDDDKMQAVLNSFKIRAANWAQIKQTYENWANIYKHQVVKALTFEQIQQLQDVFEFKGVTLVKCVNEFVNWISQHKQFYNDNFECMHEKIRLSLDEFNRNNGSAVPYINWLPEYGGMIQMQKKGEEMRWHQRNQVPFALAGSVPGRRTDN